MEYTESSYCAVPRPTGKSVLTKLSIASAPFPVGSMLVPEDILLKPLDKCHRIVCSTTHRSKFQFRDSLFMSPYRSIATCPVHLTRIIVTHACHKPLFLIKNDIWMCVQDGLQTFCNFKTSLERSFELPCT